MNIKIKSVLLKQLGQANYDNLAKLRYGIKHQVKKLIWKKKYGKDLRKYQSLNQRESFKYVSKYRRPILGEWEKSAGTLGPYFWQDLWAARLIYKNNPEEHYDIGSSIQGFIGHLCSFRDNIKLIDVRPLDVQIPGVVFVQGDAKSLKEFEDCSISSLSSLCALEHFGLGRYGDEVDPEGCFKALHEMQRILAENGLLYLSVPIGHEHLEFNAHRIFYPETIIKSLDKMQLIEFSTTGFCGDCIRHNESIHKYDNCETRGTLFGLFLFEKL